MHRNLLFSSAMALTFFWTGANAQGGEIEDVSNLLKMGKADAAKLAKGYLEPLFVGFGYGFSNGWYNTAKPHHTLGFDISLTFSAVAIPDGKRFFTINNSEYNNITVPGGSAETPTVFGPDEEGPALTYSYTHEETGTTYEGSFNGWPGMGLKEEIGFQRVPAPVLQVGIGVVKNTDIIVRYIPNMTFDDYKVGLLGFGIKHDIGQWIPVIKRLPIDISVLGAFSSFKNTYGFDDEATDPTEEAIFDIDNWTTQLLVSKKFSVLTLYGGIGYQSVTSHFNLKGEYALTGQADGPDVTLTDPLDLKFTEGAMKGTLGMRLKFGVFTLHGDYTIQKYNIWSVGLGFAFR